MTIAAHIAGEVVDVVGTWMPVPRSVSAREVRPVPESGVASSTQGAALSLLQALDTDAVRADALYADVFRRLTKYFGRRGAREPEDLAQETITRFEGDLAAPDVPSAYFGYPLNRHTHHPAVVERSDANHVIPLHQMANDLRIELAAGIVVVFNLLTRSHAK